MGTDPKTATFREARVTVTYDRLLELLDRFSLTAWHERNPALAERIIEALAAAEPDAGDEPTPEEVENETYLRGFRDGQHAETFR